MRLTISHALLTLVCLGAGSAVARAQTPLAADEAFAKDRWHAEVGLQGALEAWNYNASHEELYGLQQGLTYGLRDGLLLTITQRVMYVSQRSQDTWVLGLTGGVRGRVHERGRCSMFLGFDVGLSDTAIASPPRGTRFNYLAVGSGGAIVRIGRRVHLMSALQWTHLSNNSLKGPGRNPDIEAIGVNVGLVIGFGNRSAEE